MIRQTYSPLAMLRAQLVLFAPLARMITGGLSSSASSESEEICHQQVRSSSKNRRRLASRSFEFCACLKAALTRSFCRSELLRPGLLCFQLSLGGLDLGSQFFGCLCRRHGEGPKRTFHAGDEAAILGYPSELQGARVQVKLTGLLHKTTLYNLYETRIRPP